MISLIHPSRGRPEKALQTANDWISNSGVDTIEYILSIDRNDVLREGYDLPKNITYGAHIIHDNSCVVEAANHAAKLSCGDILIYLSDDFKCFPDWGKAVEEEFKKYSGPTLIKADDCLQPFHIRVLTIPIMNRKLYNKLGYFWNPEYKSMFVDQDLFEVCLKHGWLKFAPQLKFPHEHVSIGKAKDDDTYRRSSANWNQGKEVFSRRQLAGFPI